MHLTAWIAKIMNKVLTLICLITIPTFGYSADKLPTIQVHGVQSEQVQPQHLTTRIQWIKFPQVNYQVSELKNQNRSAIIRVQTDASGNVVNADVQDSTGLRILDEKLVNAVEQAKVKPIKKNGKSIPMIGYQTFSLNLENAQDHTQTAQCTYHFISQNWVKQEKNKSTAFSYTKQPQLSLEQDLFKNKDRVVKFKFKANKQGEISHVKLTKRSGVNAIDQQVIEAVEHAQVDVKRSYRTLWIYKQSTFKDEIKFKMNDCH